METANKKGRKLLAVLIAAALVIGGAAGGFLWWKSAGVRDQAKGAAEALLRKGTISRRCLPSRNWASRNG